MEGEFDSTARARGGHHTSRAGDRGKRRRWGQLATGLGLVGILAGASMLVPGATSGADAAVYLPGQRPAATVLTLTVGPGEEASLVHRSALLTCDPVSGSHPHGSAACRELAEVNGDFAGLKGEDGAICPLLYDPVTVTARGNWQGRSVEYEATYPNSCLLESMTKPVFDF